MKKKFIPIIGTISAGKSTFLQALLGTNVFETGTTTTTKFICLIKNSDQTKFYHVIPKKENIIEFIKEGEEINSEEKIKEKIKKINEDLYKKKGTKEEIFYMLEIPIKNIKNELLLAECYFMDIPGLNEKKSLYIDIIFSLISLDDIKFEIMIFDSTSIGSDNILNIIKKLEEKKCLKKSGNLFILNKIDKIKQIKREDEEGNKKESEVISNFKEYFYKNFEDDKNENLISINISENKFVPMNSLLFLAETKNKESFESFLIVEFFNYINSTEKGSMKTFNKYLQNKLEFTINLLKTQNISVNLDINSISEEEQEIIKKSIDNLNDIKNETNTECLIDIKLKKNDTKNNIIKLYLMHKNKFIFFEDLKYYNKLQQILKDIHSNENNLPLIPLNINNNLQDENKMEKMKKLLDKLDNFLKDTFKIIDPNDELKKFNIALQTVRENIIGRKIRIPFIGNINVGKSTVLNCLIGKNILPTNSKECTYRGIIIRHKKGESFKLYKTELIKKGGNSENLNEHENSDVYYYFEDDKKPIREGIKDIKTYLNIKNNDKTIKNKDAYLVLTGNLKIFDYIKLDKGIISKIEFIDLPGMDRVSNEFNKDGYYKKILRFSNCCIYVNESKTIDDENSINSMLYRYVYDKKKIFPLMRPNFIKMCIFLMNKSDEIKNKKDREKIKYSLFNNIKLVEEDLKKEDMNISFFSGKKFMNYLNIMNNYIYPLDKEPKKLLMKLYKEYHKNTHFLLEDFKTFIIEKISSLDHDLEENDDDDEEEIKIPEDFANKIKIELEKLENDKHKLFHNNDYKEVIAILYNLKKKYEKIDYSKDKDCSTFFEIMKTAIENSDKIFNENINKGLSEFFSCFDILFKKEIKKDTDFKKTEKTKSLENLVSIHKRIFKKILKIRKRKFLQFSMKEKLIFCK